MVSSSLSFALISRGTRTWKESSSSPCNRPRVSPISSPGSDWAAIVRSFVGHGQVSEGYDAEIVGQAILGAIHQAASEGFRSGRTQEDVVRNLTQFLVRALRP